MQLSIIIVNWNSVEYLRKCITSIVAETRDLQFEIIVIDAASYDGCGEMLQANYPDVRFIQSSENLGFARANNQAFGASVGECLLFLNPDTELLGPAVNALFRALHTLPKTGVVGCKLLNSDLTLQTSCIKAFPTLLNQLLELEVLRKLFPRARLWGMAPLFEKCDVVAHVAVVSGACMMMNRHVFESLGGFTTKYFMYSEDVDLCYKATKAGFRNYYTSAATIVHHGGGSTVHTKSSAFSSIMMMESRWRFFLSTKSRLYGVLYRMEMAIVSAVRVCLALLLCRLDPTTVDHARWSSAIEKWRARFRWAVGLEKWAERL